MKRSSASRLHRVWLKGVGFLFLLLPLLLVVDCGEKEEPWPSPMLVYLLWILRVQPDRYCVDDSLSTPIVAGVPVTNSTGGTYRFVQSAAVSTVTYTANDPACDIIGALSYCTADKQRIPWYYVAPPPGLACLPDTTRIRNGTPWVCTVTVPSGTRMLASSTPFDSSAPCSSTIQYTEP